MIRVGKISVCLIALFVLSACDDKQALTESQARRTLQDFYDAHPVCASMAIGFPVEIDNVSYFKGPMEALTKAGLIVVSGTRYRVTTAGESALQPGADKFLGGTDICFAKRSVQKITVMTTPAEVAGVMIATVTYDYACLMTFRADRRKRNRWERVATLSQRRGMDRDVAGRLTGRVRV